jgi:hypothetical protein
MLHEYNVTYSVAFYPQFDVTAVGLGMYYLLIRRHYCIDKPAVEFAYFSSLLIWFEVTSIRKRHNFTLHVNLPMLL